MRWHIIRTLLGKEVRRQRANRGGLVLAILLVVAALLMTFLGRGGGVAALTGGVDSCFVDYWQDDALVQHLRENVPVGLNQQIHFRPVQQATVVDGILVYPPGTGAIQIRIEQDPAGHLQRRVIVWHPGTDSRAMAEYECWFWRETAGYFQQKVAETERKNEPDAGMIVESDPLRHEQATLTGGTDMRSALTVGLVMFALFFSCIYLLPSLMCEERERGTLLAQVLSPASHLEILAAKFLLYPVAGMTLGALLAGIARPSVLTEPLFWLAMAVTAVGSLGIGLSIASVARTQRAASVGALCYMLVVAMFLFICQQANIVGLPYLALEYHGPRMLHAALGGTVDAEHWTNLAVAAGLSLGWCLAAAHLFRTRGWQ
jgi:hypothetical protein